MSRDLPSVVSPLRLARAGARLQGTVSGGRLPRLAEIAREAVEGVAVALEFTPHGRDRTRVRGTIGARVVMECQRCLGAVTVELDVGLEVVTVEADEAPPTGEGPELVEAPGDRLSVARLVEDEVLLALPSYPTHPPGECEPPGPRSL